MRYERGNDLEIMKGTTVSKLFRVEHQLDFTVSMLEALKQTALELRDLAR